MYEPFKQWFRSAAALSAVCAVSSGCTVSATGTTVAPIAGTGDIVVDWTIAGTHDPNECAVTQTAAAAIDVFDIDGVKANPGADTQDCEAFSSSFPYGFDPGSYTVDVTLLAADGTPTTTTASASVDVFSEQLSTVPFDFPPSSFF
jgi:hypothetical protein